MTNNALIKSLRAIGFEDTEAKIYLASLELGPNSVWNISQKSAIKRTSCYKILEEMVMNGYAKRSYDTKRTLYQVMPPRNLLEQFARRTVEFEKNIQQFDILTSKCPEKPLISHFEGKDAQKNVLKQILDLPDGSKAYISSSKSKFVKELEASLKTVKEKNISLSVLLPEGARIEGSDILSIRFINKQKFAPILETIIFDNKVVYMSSLFATVIESTSLAQDEIQKFELLCLI